MAASAGAQRQYSLTIVSASEVGNVPSSPALYVTLALSRNKVCKTATIRTSTPTWNHPIQLIAGLSSVLTFRLKSFRGRLVSPSVVGSVNITSADLLNRRNEEQQTTLTLLDNRRRSVGLLIVRLQEEADSASHRTVEATGSEANYRVEGQGSIVPHSSLELVRVPVEPAEPRHSLRNDVVELLKQVVDKIEIAVDKLDETTKLRSYANIARHVIGLAHKSALGQTDRAKALRGLAMSLTSLYSSAHLGGGDPSGDLEVITRITVQTIECGIFIQQYVFHRAPQTISNIQQTISRLSNALTLLKTELETSGTPPTAFVSAQAFQDANGQVGTASLRALLEPAGMDAEPRERCLPGTRVDILQNLFTFLIDPNANDKVIWLRGPAGSGKSTILNTIAQYSAKLRRCGASLFWDRNDAVNSAPRRVIRTLAYQLAQSNPAFAKELVSQIKAFPQIMESPLREQFETLLQDPLATAAASHDSGPIIIILDALDECGTPKTRERLLDVLSTSLTKLPRTFRVLIASRDEPDIRVALLLLRPPVIIRDVRIDDESMKSDISHFFQQRLSSDARAFAGRGLPPDWPGDLVRQQLVALSGGLFIWASTTIRFVESGLPEQRLKTVLDSVHGQSHDRLDRLYRVALTHPFDTYNDDELEAVHSILGAISVACAQLTDEQLSRLLNLGLSTVREVLSRLQPLLQGGHGKPIQVLHTSFTDFLCDPTRRQDELWRINASAHHYNLVAGCLRVMKQDLKFNICDIETSFCRHQEIQGIRSRIDKAVTPLLMYASQYWAEHLELGSIAESESPRLVGELMEFIMDRLLFWVEVFSLKNQMSTISVILRKATNWAKKCNPELEAVISEANKFVNAFGYPISQSVPHIYLTALPFSPSQSAALQRIRTAFQNTLLVEAGKSNRWPVISQTLVGHTASVTSVAFSPDSARVVSGSHDGTIRMWDAVSGMPIGDPLRGHSGPVSSTSFLFDGARIVSGSNDKTVRVWDVVSGTPIGGPLLGHLDEVFSVAWSPNGTRIISGSADRTIRIWDAMTGAPVSEPLKGHSSLVVSVAFSPDGTRIISGSSDCTVQIWEAASGTPIGEPLRGHSGSVWSVAYSPTGTRISSGSSDRTIRVWDAMSGAPIGEPLRGHDYQVNSVVFSSDGTRIISGSDDSTVRMWDAVIGAPVGTPLRGHFRRITSVALSPDGTRIASGSADHTLRMWDAISTPVHEPLHQHSQSVMSVAYSPDGTHIISGSCDSTIRKWNAKSGVPAGDPLRGHSGAVRSVAFSPDGTRIVSGSFDQTVRVWNSASGTQIDKPLEGHSATVTSVAFSINNTRIVSGSEDKTIRIWDALAGAAIGEPLRGHHDWVGSVSFSPDGTRIVSGSADETVRIWDAVTTTPIHELKGHSDKVRSVVFSPDGAFIVSGSDDKTVRIWDAVSGMQISEPLRGHSGWVRSVAYFPNGARIVSGSADRTVRIWDTALGALIGEPLQGHSHHVVSVAISPDGAGIASASDDNTIRIWDTSLATADSVTQQHGPNVVSVNAHYLRNESLTNCAPVFSNGSVLREDGWVTTDDGLLFWVPPEYRSRLMWPRTRAIIGAQPVQINFERFFHGPHWEQCHTKGY